MRPAKFSLLPWNNTTLLEASMEVADGSSLESVDWYFRASRLKHSLEISSTETTSAFIEINQGF